MIYYLIFCLLISAVIFYAYGQWSSQKKEHLTNCLGESCPVNESGPMDPSYTPSCFFYDIDTQNKQLYDAANQTAERLDKEVDRSMNLNKMFSDLATEYNNKLTTFMKGSVVEGTRNNMSIAVSALSKSLESNKLDSNINLIYDLNQKEMEKVVKSALEEYLATVLNKFIKDSNIDFNGEVRKAITSDIRNRISLPIMQMWREQINQQANQDIVNVLRSIIKKINIEKNIPILVNNAISGDSTLKKLEEVSKNMNIELGDFVYFKHRLTKPVQFLCADNESQYDIIVGGKICSINYVNSTVRLSYLYVMNPNDNSRCNGSLTSAPNQITKVDYSAGPEGLPKWYIPINLNALDCGVNAPANLACYPSQWDAASDKWVQEWIGGMDRASNKMLCGVSPTGYQLPQDVPFGVLSKNLNLLLQECQMDLSLIKRI